MTENPNQPREYDAVLGDQNPPPLGAAVLGGISGVKSRLASPIVEVKSAALSEALKYGDAGLDLIIGALQNESMAVKFAAYSLLKDRDEPNIKQQLQNYLPIFEFDVITVDADGKQNSRHRHYARFFTEDLGNEVVLEMVSIPGGTFMMGSPTTEPGRSDNESPQHQVTVPAFYAGKYPITQAQWQAVMGNNPLFFKGDEKAKKSPLEAVTWDMAFEFCAKLSQKTGKKYRLLSEAEWEYACRAGTTTPFHFGETITPELVNYLVNYDEFIPDENTPEGFWYDTTDVGSFPPNAFGLYDMHGNVYEWCSDTWHENYNGAPTDGSSWETGTDYNRVQRGGCCRSYAGNCRSAYRHLWGSPDNWHYRPLWSSRDNWYLGFRVALVSASPPVQKYFPTSDFFKFDAIEVDAEGQEKSRRRHYAHFFTEDLGNEVVLEMVDIPGGTFMMGSPVTESGRSDNESPQHQVTVPAFYAGKYPITQAQWQAVMGNNPSFFRGEERPVEQVSWYGAVEFCAKLSQKTGKKYRLLSEAEWEYACRAGTTTPFHSGETITPLLVNYSGISYANTPKGNYNSRQTTDVGSFPPNAFGLYDMHGNVLEWCSDTWHENYNGAPTDGSSWETGTDYNRVQRGGYWDGSAIECRSALRSFCSAEEGWLYWGFRVAVGSVSP